MMVREAPLSRGRRLQVGVQAPASGVLKSRLGGWVEKVENAAVFSTTLGWSRCAAAQASVAPFHGQQPRPQAVRHRRRRSPATPARRPSRSSAGADPLINL